MEEVDNTMAKRNRTNNNLQKHYTEIKQHEPHCHNTHYINGMFHEGGGDTGSGWTYHWHKHLDYLKNGMVQRRYENAKYRNICACKCPKNQKSILLFMILTQMSSSDIIIFYDQTCQMYYLVKKNI